MKSLLVISLLIFGSLSWAQKNFTLSGNVKNISSGEELIGARIKTTVNGETVGVLANNYGFYSLTIPEGQYVISFSFVGMATFTKEVSLHQNMKIDVEMKEENTLEKVLVTSEAGNSNVTSTEMSVEKLSITQIRKMPALMGEVDIIKAIQMLPGVATVGEGGSGFYVRGGSVDQNLILLDEANVYNASHLMGFFSVFNPDVVKEVELYKGGIPAQYGGRLSSVLDVRMKEGNMKRFAMSGGIGTISSRISIGGPIVKDKGSVILSARRTYADIFLNFAKDEDLKNSKLHFYDVNLKANYKLNDNNRVFLSGYLGRDVFGVDKQFRIDWGNAAATARWNHVFSDKLFLNTTATFSNYDYFLGEPEGLDAYEWTSNIKDYYLKTDFSYYINPTNTLKFGGQAAYHQIDPGQATGIGESILDEFVVPKTNGLEQALYVSHELKLGKRFTTLYGLRFSSFQNIGATTYYDFDENYDVSDTIEVAKGEIYNKYYGFEPRIGATFLLNESSSIKASYNRTFQYVHLASNSTASSPLDIWFPSSPNVKPQMADQTAAGYFKNFKKDTYQASVEVYYKQMQNAIDFKDHATLVLNPQLEGELRFGTAYAYGAEFLIKKTKGNFTGWIGYTLSRTQKKIDGINNNELYFAKYDKTHDLSVILSYDLGKSWTFSTNFVYSTGAAVTMPIGKMEYMGMTVPIYSERNGKRMPDYHRLDFAVTWRPKKTLEKKWKSEWVFSAYNCYNRANPYSINFVTDEADPTQTKAQMLYLFGIVPSITYNFKF
ncbi:MAG: collagen-binding protein [Crocinitomix sp. MedPE-SWsnd]|nr:MAG: collagen-binding protein [Crocinitomix sp. MedPE-SWsnd]